MYMLDTNIFNMLTEGRLQTEQLPSDGMFFATYVQLQEINQTKDSTNRRRLLETFHEVTHHVAPVETALFGVTPFGEGKYGGGSHTFTALLERLNERNGSRANNASDVLIAETAIANQLTLITSDSDLAAVVGQFGAPVLFHRYNS